jgi:protein gp37
MSTTIEWTQRPGTKGETWNPTIGCNKVSQGCKNCYAEVMHRRLTAMGVKGYDLPFLAGARPMHDRLTIPFKWKKPRTVFVNSMSDLFHEAVPFSFIDQVFAVMALTPQHTYQVLTKRPERMAEYLNDSVSIGHNRRCIEAEILKVMDANGLPTTYIPWVAERLNALPNVWLGTSAEDQRAADERIPHLLRCPAAVRFMSCEPLLGAVDLENITRGRERLCVLRKSAYDPDSTIGKWLPIDRGIDWVIAGGESGHGARPMHPDWARSLRDQCQAAGVPFFFKQWGAWVPATIEHGVTGHVMPENDPKYTWIGWDGTCKAPSFHGLNEPIMAIAKVGKRASGNLLDGRTHLEYPTTP